MLRDEPVVYAEEAYLLAEVFIAEYSGKVIFRAEQRFGVHMILKHALFDMSRHNNRRDREDDRYRDKPEIHLGEDNDSRYKHRNRRKKPHDAVRDLIYCSAVVDLRRESRQVMYGGRFHLCHVKLRHF